MDVLGLPIVDRQSVAEPHRPTPLAQVRIPKEACLERERAVKECLCHALGHREGVPHGREEVVREHGRLPQSVHPASTSARDRPSHACCGVFRPPWHCLRNAFCSFEPHGVDDQPWRRSIKDQGVRQLDGAADCILQRCAQRRRTERVESGIRKRCVRIDARATDHFFGE
eukprot:7192849-Prymnesium_polylepis.1